MKMSVGDYLILKKPHACGSYKWQVKRTGVEYIIKCDKCGRELLIFKQELLKKIKSIENTPKNEQ